MPSRIDKNFEITDTIKGNLYSKGLPFYEIKNAVLGRKHRVSLVFVGDKVSRCLNRKFKGKNKPANVLSFPLSEKSGEIFINPSWAAKQANLYGMKSNEFIGFLFIHALLHLKGLTHGSKMEGKERRFMARFRI